MMVIEYIKTVVESATHIIAFIVLINLIMIALRKAVKETYKPPVTEEDRRKLGIALLRGAKIFSGRLFKFGEFILYRLPRIIIYFICNLFTILANQGDKSNATRNS